MTYFARVWFYEYGASATWSNSVAPRPYRGGTTSGWPTRLSAFGWSKTTSARPHSTLGRRCGLSAGGSRTWRCTTFSSLRVRLLRVPLRVA